MKTTHPGWAARAILANLWIGAAILFGGPEAALAQGSGARALEGVWAFSVGLRDCTSGAALGPPFRSLLTFHQSGTVSESTGALNFAPGQRTQGHGGFAAEISDGAGGKSG